MSSEKPSSINLYIPLPSCIHFVFQTGRETKDGIALSPNQSSGRSAIAPKASVLLFLKRTSNTLYVIIRAQLQRSNARQYNRQRTWRVPLFDAQMHASHVALYTKRSGRSRILRILQVTMPSHLIMSTRGTYSMHSVIYPRYYKLLIQCSPIYLCQIDVFRIIICLQLS